MHSKTKQKWTCADKVQRHNGKIEIRWAYADKDQITNSRPTQKGLYCYNQWKGVECYNQWQGLSYSFREDIHPAAFLGIYKVYWFKLKLWWGSDKDTEFNY